jgi:hypothetical protein
LIGVGVVEVPPEFAVLRRARKMISPPELVRVAVRDMSKTRTIFEALPVMVKMSVALAAIASAETLAEYVANVPTAGDDTSLPALSLRRYREVVPSNTIA